MSSIAYVTDEKMIEYHRLCGNRSMNFWRLSARSGFTNFRRGDLLFFYARRGHMRSKALLGYAHYVATEKLSLRQMWNKYGNANGYDSKEQMEEAIRKAARSGKVPEKLNCLYLTDAVYFREPVIPEEIGITISSQLESYCYLDREDPQVTVRILKQAEKGGIDLWSAAQSFEPENSFRADEVRHQLAVIRAEIGRDGRNGREETRARRLARQRLKEPGWEMIRGSETDCFRMENDVLTIALPFAWNTMDRDIRMKELMGTVAMYRIKAEAHQLPVSRICFDIISEAEEPDLDPLLKVFNHE